MSPEPSPQTGKVSRRGLALSGVIAIVVLTVVVVDGVWSRNANDARLKQETNAQAVPTVLVSIASHGFPLFVKCWPGTPRAT